ncbi:MAG: hypothetical protein LIO65_03320 [Odoribacter sp.]|nr:hypothetical protein [Odoribacter sp.]
MPTYPSLKPRIVHPDLFGGKRNSFHAFTEEDSIQELTLDELSRTNHEKNPRTGGPSQNDVHHDEFINQVMNIAEYRGFAPQITELFAAQNKVQRLPGVTIIEEIENEKGPRAIEAHILRRIFASIKLSSPKLSNDEGISYPCIAIAYHQKGIQVGLGSKVVVCHNQMLLNADSYIATYEDGFSRKVEKYTTIYSIIQQWLDDLLKTQTEEEAIIKRLKNIRLGINTIRFIFGLLIEERTRFETSNLPLNKVVPVMNFGQIREFTEDTLRRLYNSLDFTLSLWDIYDIATNAFKPWLTSDFPVLISQNRGFAKLVLYMEQVLSNNGQQNLPIPQDTLAPNDALRAFSQRLKDQINRDINRIFHETIGQRLNIR